MSVYVVSDLHGASDELAKAVPEGASLVLLGDLINFIDYTSMTGILTEVFSVEAVEHVVRLRTAGEVDEARRVMHERSRGREDRIPLISSSATSTIPRWSRDSPAAARP
jgi:hypothetical protein